MVILWQTSNGMARILGACRYLKGIPHTGDAGSLLVVHTTRTPDKRGRPQSRPTCETVAEQHEDYMKLAASSKEPTMPPKTVPSLSEGKTGGPSMMVAEWSLYIARSLVRQDRCVQGWTQQAVVMPTCTPAVRTLQLLKCSIQMFSRIVEWFGALAHLYMAEASTSEAPGSA